MATRSLIVGSCALALASATLAPTPARADGRVSRAWTRMIWSPPNPGDPWKNVVGRDRLSPGEIYMLNPQPLPPGEKMMLNPQPLPPLILRFFR